MPHVQRIPNETCQELGLRTAVYDVTAPGVEIYLLLHQRVSLSFGIFVEECSGKETIVAVAWPSKDHFIASPMGWSMEDLLFQQWQITDPYLRTLLRHFSDLKTVRYGLMIAFRWHGTHKEFMDTALAHRDHVACQNVIKPLGDMYFLVNNIIKAGLARNSEGHTADTIRLLHNLLQSQGKSYEHYLPGDCGSRPRLSSEQQHQVLEAHMVGTPIFDKSLRGYLEFNEIEPHNTIW